MTTQTTSHLHTTLRGLAVFLLLLFGSRAQAQITTSSCNNAYFFCTLDTVTLAPDDDVTYTNFVWYANSVAPANEITVANAASHNVDPTRLGNNTIYVSAPGGVYILTSEYATPAGCATRNDTLDIQFLPVPDLVTTADSICASAGGNTDLATLVTDNNGTTGSTQWFATLAHAQAGAPVLGSTVVSPASTTKYYVRKTTTALDAESQGCYDIDSVTIEVRCLSLGNLVWYDTNNDGDRDGGEAPIAGVTVQLFYDADDNGSISGAEELPYATDVTDVGGLYLFEGLPPGKFYVGVPAFQFTAGNPLQYLYSSGTSRNGTGVISETAAPAPDANDSDTDDNATIASAGFYSGGIMSSVVTLDFQSEPDSESPNNASGDDEDANLTVDFGFYGMSIGNNVFADVNNNGLQDGAEGGISGVTVILYAADGTTVIATTTTDNDGNYLFTNLPEGSYIVGVDLNSSSLDGQHSSDDIATSGTPESTLNDDNGVTTVGSVLFTNTIVLDAGNEPTGEPNDGDSLGNPAVADNPSTPDENSNQYIGFGFVPDCPTITNPFGAQTICAEDGGSNLIVNTNQNVEDIRFVRFTSAQTGDNMYSGGTQIGSDFTPVGASDPYSATYSFDTNDFTNTGSTPVTYYVYAILASAPADPTCRPYQEIQVVVNPKPIANPTSLTACETTLGGGSGDFDLTDADGDVIGSQTGVTVTYHVSQTDADNADNALTSPYASAPATIYVRVENTYGCYSTSQVSLNVNAKPDFTLGLATVCPGENPEVTISGLLNGDAVLSTTSVNGGTFNPYDASPPNLTTADGILLDAMNTITVRNENGCETSKTINVPDVTPLVCPPVNVTVKRVGE